MMAGMGVAVSDYDHSGHESLFVTNFSNETNTLYHNQGQLQFTDMTERTGLGEISLSSYVEPGSACATCEAVHCLDQGALVFPAALLIICDVAQKWKDYDSVGRSDIYRSCNALVI